MPPTAKPPAVWAAWPDEFSHTRKALTRLLENSPRYEESWNDHIFVILTQVFPAASPSLYVWKPQYNLRHALNAPNSLPRASTDSVDSGDQPVVAPGRTLQDEVRMKPDFLVAQGERGSQRMVALIEIEKKNQVNRDDGERFINYCSRLLNHTDNELSKGVTAILISGGYAYFWDHTQMVTLVKTGKLDDSSLAKLRDEKNRVFKVDDIAFWNALEVVRDRFIKTG